jgi:hypothetical protein
LDAFLDEIGAAATFVADYASPKANVLRLSNAEEFNAAFGASWSQEKFDEFFPAHPVSVFRLSDESEAAE